MWRGFKLASCQHESYMYAFQYRGGMARADIFTELNNSWALLHRILTQISIMFSHTSHVYMNNKSGDCSKSLCFSVSWIKCRLMRPKVRYKGLTRIYSVNFVPTMIQLGLLMEIPDCCLRVICSLYQRQCILNSEFIFTGAWRDLPPSLIDSRG